MKNQSEFTLYETDDKGVTHTIVPGEDIPSGVKVTNPYVLGKADDGDDDGGDPTDESPRRGRPRKAADAS